MADTKITLLDEGMAVNLLDWLVAVDVSFVSGAGAMGADGTDVKWRVQTVVDFLKTHMQPLVQTISDKTADYTPVVGDKGKILTMTSGLNKVITMPQFTTAAFEIGSWFEVIQLGAGHAQFLPEGGLSAYQTRLIGSRVRCQLIALDTWHLSGDLELI